MLPLLLLCAAGSYHEVTEKAGPELPIGVTFTLWIPDGVKTLRGVIVHQHGCGVGACKGGATAAYDLHWQALARRHGCALLGPSYHQAEKQNCRLWCDPRNGSGKAFLRALAHFAKEAKRPELESAPWCLWGHSGGGFWASLMHAQHPDRVVACWLRSGTAYPAWMKGEVPKPELSEAVFKVPVVLNPGLKEKGDKRFAGAWTGSVAMFEAYRAKGAPVAIAADPRTAHECGDSRYLAIPFFDACLAARLPGVGTRLNPAPVGVTVTDGELKKEHWLPSESVAKAWKEYVVKGAVSDATPPPAPTGVKVKRDGGMNVITWDAEADFESGLRGFAVLRGGEEIATLPQKPVGRFGRPLFQTMSYHDTPEQPLPRMAFIDKGAPDGATYEVIAVNSVGLRSKPGK